MKSILDQIREDEGFSGTVYLDSVGKHTVGFGRNLDDNPLTVSEANYLLQSDIDKISRRAMKFSFYANLNPARRGVILNMIYTMGIGSFKGFGNMIAALYDSNYEKAADEMLDSKWHRELNKLGSGRAKRLSNTMRYGR
jgi:lysozyme